MQPNRLLIRMSQIFDYLASYMDDHESLKLPRENIMPYRPIMD